MKPIAFSGIGLSLALAVCALPAIAQNQPTSQDAPAGGSLGNYARQVRKDSGSPSKAKVFDNDNLPREDKLSVVGTPRAPEAPADTKQEDQSSAGQNKPATAAAQPAPADKSAGSTPAEDQAAKEQAWKQWGDKLSSQKDQIDLLQRELDVLQREYQIRAAAMYADVGNRLRNSADWDQKDAQYKQQIADKQKSVDDAKQKLEDMQEEARKAGVPSSVREP
ncbi:MAG: hypothetical protein ACRD3B_08990 [Candidatus Sulfotelmatobacter sp.]